MNTILDLFIYPFKSLAACRVSEIEVLSDASLRFDRKWMLMDEQQNFLTQRQIPQLVLFSVQILSNNIMQIGFKGNVIRAPFYPESSASISIKVWGRTVQALIPEDQALSEWFSDCLQKKVTAVFFASSENTPAHRAAAFSDSSPLLVISSASLSALNNRLKTPVSPLHFRPNAILSSNTPFFEDQASEINSGEVTMRFIKPCSRCIMVNVLPLQGLVSPKGEPLKTLSSFRRSGLDAKVQFGVYFSPTAGFLKTGQPYNFTSHVS